MLYSQSKTDRMTHASDALGYFIQQYKHASRTFTAEDYQKLQRAVAWW
jgi:hypothetical protein